MSRILLKQLACLQQICGKKIISFCPRVPTTHIPITRRISFQGKTALMLSLFHKTFQMNFSYPGLQKVDTCLMMAKRQQKAAPT